MSKYFHRFIAILLVFCLAAEPIENRFSLTQRETRNLKPETVPAPFDDQALTLGFIWCLHSLASSSPAIHHWVGWAGIAILVAGMNCAFAVISAPSTKQTAVKANSELSLSQHPFYRR